MYTGMLLYMRSPVKTILYNARGEKVEEITLPDVFRLPVRKDLIRRVYLSEFTMGLQPKGRDPMAGKRTSAESLGAHRGVSRVPRVKGSLRGAMVNMTRGGRLAHPPRVEKKIHEYVNKKEKKIGTMSALAATTVPELVKERGHVFSAEALPVVLEPEALDVAGVKNAISLLQAVGVYDDIMRARRRIRTRAGKGKRRGRRLKKPVSVLFILSEPNSPLAKAVKGLPGVTVASPELVSVLDLAPGGEPGRLTVIDKASLDILSARFRVDEI